MGYDDYSSKNSYDKEVQAQKLESKRKTKQTRDRRNLVDVASDDYDEYSGNRRY